MEIKNSTLENIDEIFALYRIASEYMKSKNQAAYPKFSTSLIETEIEENRQWKLVIERQMACIWATTFDDPIIWEEKNKDLAVYIHRIVTNPNFRGKNLVKHILEWSKNFAKNHQKKYVRLDTVGNNQSLINHYTKVGFNFLGLHKLKTIEGLPAHYQLGEVCLFELSI